MRIRIKAHRFLNSCRFKKGLWKKTTPKGLKLKKLVEGPDGTLTQDTSYVGDNAWDDETDETTMGNVKDITDINVRLNTEEKRVLQEGLGVSG